MKTKIISFSFLARNKSIRTVSSTLLMTLLAVSAATLYQTAVPNLTQTNSAAAMSDDSSADLPIAEVSASDYRSGYEPGKVLDDDLETRWSQNGNGVWILADMGADKIVCYVDIAWFRGDQRVAYFTVSVSTEGDAFKEVFKGQSSGNTLQPERYLMPSTVPAARYVKITVYGNTENNMAGITELDIYGNSGSSLGDGTIDTIPPALTIIYPSNGATISGTIVGSASASDASGINKVAGFLDSNPLNVEYYSPYEFSIDTTKYSNGSHNFKVVATDNNGNIASSEIYFNINNEVSVAPPESEPAPTETKIMRPLWLPYADLQGQLDAYKPVLQDYDWPRLRMPDSSNSIPSDDLAAFMSLKGHKLLSVTTLEKVKAHTAWAKSQGFAGVEYNIEGGFDAGDTDAQIREAASVVHASGLKFVSTPTKAILADSWEIIADVADIVHIQAQTLQSDPDEFDTFVANWVKKLKAQNPNLVVTVQTGTGQSAAPGMTLLETFQECTDRVIVGSDAVDGVSVWFGSGEEELMGSYFGWYHEKYR